MVLFIFQNVFVHQLDLSNTAKISEFVENFSKSPGTLDVLVRLVFISCIHNLIIGYKYILESLLQSDVYVII